MKECPMEQGGHSSLCAQRGFGSRWADPGACAALCLLILDDRRSSGQTKRRALPPALYAENVAPFLRFDVPLPNMLYAFGGRNQSYGPLDTVEMLDTWHGCWVTCPSMPTRRAGSAAALLPNGHMLVVGGYNEKGIAEGLLATCDAYDPFKRRWQEPGSVALLTRARWGHGCAPLGGKVYVAGGCSLQPEAQPREAFMETLGCCEVYDPVANTWTAGAPLQIARSGFRIVALDGDRYLAAVGGCDNVFGRAETQPTVELFDGLTGYWSLLERRLTQPRTTAGAVAVGNHELLVMGGAPSLSSAEVYHVSLPGTDRYSENEAQQCGEICKMQEGRMGCQAAVVSLPRPGSHYPLSVQPCAVIIGGERCEESGGDMPRIRQFANAPVFDIRTRSWRRDEVVPPLPSARTAVALCVGLARLNSD